jgi:hypothetical protein
LLKWGKSEIKFAIYATADSIRNINYLFTKSVTELHTHKHTQTHAPIAFSSAENVNRRIGKLINFDVEN